MLLKGWLFCCQSLFTDNVGLIFDLGCLTSHQVFYFFKRIRMQMFHAFHMKTDIEFKFKSEAFAYHFTTLQMEPTTSLVNRISVHVSIADI